MTKKKGKQGSPRPFAQLTEVQTAFFPRAGEQREREKGERTENRVAVHGIGWERVSSGVVE
jgi:hypothetical protein